jgi:hypothetical protein
VSLLVDTSVWSLVLRRGAPPDVPEVRALRDALAGGEIAATTGVILQELLQGVVTERARTQIIEMFAALEYLTPSSRRSRRCGGHAPHVALRRCSGRHEMPSSPTWPSLVVTRSSPRTTTSAPIPEHLPRCSRRLAVEGLADPASAVDRRMPGGVGEDREDALRRGVNDRGRANGIAGHGGRLLMS